MQGKYRPWHPYSWENDLVGVRALQALAKGVATESQQKEAWRLILDVCGIDEWMYIPNSQRDTDMGLGRQFVGNQLLKLAKLNSTILNDND